MKSDNLFEPVGIKPKFIPQVPPKAEIPKNNWRDKYEEKPNTSSYKLENSADDSELNRAIQLKTFENTDLVQGKPGKIYYDKVNGVVKVYIDDTEGWVNLLTDNATLNLTKTVTKPSQGQITFGSTSIPKVFGFLQTIVNLSTTPIDLFGGSTAGASIIHFGLINTAGDIATFTIYVGVDGGVAWKYTYTGGANCSITESAEGVFVITGMGDGRTYTLTFTTGASAATIVSDALTAGNTVLRMAGFSFQ